LSLLHIAASDQLPAGQVLGVQVRLGQDPKLLGPAQESGPPGTVAVALARDGEGAVHAIGNLCTHGPVLLSEGAFEDDKLECWGHGSRFCIMTGQPANLPATEAVPVFPVVERDGAIYLEVEAHP
jgi:3-phenylpropionate/trans-cinnamate dioxygenase ferredoxin subunit